MSRHQLRLLLASLASIACLIASLFAMPWFRVTMGFGDALVELDLRSARSCLGGGTCVSVPLSMFKGFYPAIAGIAFWCSLPLLLTIVFQCASRLLTLGANPAVTRFGYLIAIVVATTGFAAGFLFAPEGISAGNFGSIVIERTAAPVLFVLGSFLSMFALYAAIETVENNAEYVPVVLDKGRLPVTPLSGVNKVAVPPSGATVPLEGPLRSPADGGTPRPGFARAPTGPGATRTPAGSGTSKNAPRAPGEPLAKGSQPPADALRSKAGSNPPADARAKTSSQQPLADARAKTSSQQPLADARAKTSSQQPLSEARAKTSSQQPLVARTVSPSGVVDSRAKTTPLPELQVVAQRGHTSSSGPIDLAARLSATSPEVAIRPPLPTPEPVPPDQIPVAPESGLTIRKRSPTANPMASGGLAEAMSTLAPVGFELSSVDSIPVAPESGLTIRKKSPSQAPTPDALADAMKSPVPPQLRGKIRYTALTAALSGTGLIAKREDGASKIVKWGDIVGIVARRLPPDLPYDGHTFIDIVSSAGSTLRILPWTEIIGHVLKGTPEERARELLHIAAAQALDAKLDAATRLFADGKHAAQLPTLATLATHDQRLA